MRFGLALPPPFRVFGGTFVCSVHVASQLLQETTP